MGATLFVGALQALIVIAAVAHFDSTFVGHSEFDYDDTLNEQTHASSSHDGAHDE